MSAFSLARLLFLLTAVYLLVRFRSVGVDAPFMAAAAATATLFLGVLRKPRRNRMKWLLPTATATYALSILAALVSHLLLGLPPGERIVPSAFLLFGIALALRSAYKATTPVSRGRANYFDT